MKTFKNQYCALQGENRCAMTLERDYQAGLMPDPEVLTQAEVSFHS